MSQNNIPENESTLSDKENKDSSVLLKKTENSKTLEIKEAIPYLRELLKNSIANQTPKTELYIILKKTLEQLLKEIEKESYPLIFDDFFFEKMFLLLDKKMIFQFFEILEIVIVLISKEEFLVYLSTLKQNRKIFTNFLNYLLTSYELLHQTKLGIEIKFCLVGILEFLKKNNFMKSDNSKLIEIYEKYCTPFKLQEEHLTNLDRLMNTINKSDIKKYELLNYVNFLLRDCSSYIDQMNIFVSVADQIFSQLIKIHSTNYSEIDSKKLLLIDELLNFFEKILSQYEYYITIDQNYIQETKIYVMSTEKKILQLFPNLYFIFGRLMNEILLIPFETKYQNKALILMRRFFKLHPNLRQFLYNPINVLMSNLSLFSNELKESAIYLYQLINTSNEKELINILNSNENLKFIKENKYFSVKATSYPQEVDVIYNIVNLNLNVFYPIKKIIDAEGFFCLNLYVKHEYSLIYWKFNTVDYDISFGLYKLHLIEDFPFSNYDQYIKEGKLEAVIKNVRVNSHQSSVTGATLVINPGLYRLVFDNSYSFWRAKTLFYCVHLLEKKRNDDPDSKSFNNI